MRITEFILLASLVAIGTVSFLDQQAMSRARLERIVRREQRLKADLDQIRQRQRRLQNEAEALRQDPYYIERMAREQLAWRPVYSPVPPPRPPAAPLGTGGVLVDGEGRRQGSSSDRRAAQGRVLLAALGYDSARHFQRKMMGGRATGEIDGRTVARARGLLALLRRCGFSSVERFQARHGLTTDGILGQRTEKKLREALRNRSGRAGRRRSDGVVVHGGDDGRPRPGG